MDSLIREVNENLKTIIDNLKENVDNSSSILENIQLQMDKKVEEAKKYKIQVDTAKSVISELEDDNDSLEFSLKELQDKYGKMNLISVIEAGNKEIKSKINDNIREINKQKDHIAELTSKARTIKDLLLNLKKDKTLKEEKLENLKVVYSFYSDKLNSIMNYAFDHSENLTNYKDDIIIDDEVYEEVEEKDISDLDNTMVFDEIANIDEKDNFKDEMTFINDEIESTFNDNFVKDEENIEEGIEFNPDIEYNSFDLEDKNTDDNLFEDVDDNNSFSLPTFESEDIENEVEDNSNIFSSDIFHVDEVKEDIDEKNDVSEINENNVDFSDVFKIEGIKEENILEDNSLNIANDEIINNNELVSNDLINNLESFKLDNNSEEISDLEIDNTRINKINDLFSSLDNTKTDNISLDNISKVENDIDNAYVDIFGKPLDEESLNKKETTLTDIFGNPISKEEISESVKLEKKIEELFVEYGIDFNKFKEDEQGYLKQIYNEEKFIGILEVLKNHKINLDNIYYSFNIFGEITSSELDSLITKFVNVGQSIEAIGIILEKLPKVKKYNLDEAIVSYGEYVNNIDITELIIKAKELYENGGNL